jgi:phenylacetic acid degradation operon negative regulatory protein
VAEQHTPRSLIVSFYGAYGRDRGGWVAVADLIRLMEALGVDAQSVRSSVSRLKRGGLLVAAREEGTAGYALSDGARQVLADGDRRIYGRPRPRLEDGWVLAVFSVPESERHRRHLLRSQLTRLGFGTAAPGVWIAPAHVAEEARHTLERLGLSAYVDLFTGHHRGFTPTPEAVRRWWDLDALAAAHRAFLDVHEPVLRRRGRRPAAAEAADGSGAFADYLRALDAWRHLPYLDPGLPPPLLPARWPGTRSAEVFHALHELLREPGARYVARVRDPAARGSAVQGPEVRGSVVRGSAVRGSVVRGPDVHGSAVPG